MTCERAERYFSHLLDDVRSDPVPAWVGEHIEQCDACHEAFERFCVATEALRASSPPPTSDGSASAIMRAIDVAAYEVAGAPNDSSPVIDRDAVFRRAMRPRPRSIWRRAGGHGLSAAAGAAAAVLLLAFTDRTAPSDDRGSTEIGAIPVVQVQPSPPPADEPRVEARSAGAEIRFVSGAGNISRDGRVETIDGSVTIYPGEVVEITVPTLEVIERRGPWLAVDFNEIDMTAAQDTIDRSLGLVKDSYLVLRDRLSYVNLASLPAPIDELPVPEVRSPEPPARTLRTPDAPPHAAVASLDRRPIDRPIVDARRVEPRPVHSSRSTIPTVEPTRSSLPPAQPMPPRSSAGRFPAAPVVLARDPGGRLSLQTQGSVTEVIPRLIAFLEDPDADVVQLVEERLALLRGELARDPALASHFARSDAAFDARIAIEPSLADRLLGRDPAPANKKPSAYWSHWWETNAVHLLQSESQGLF